MIRMGKLKPADAKRLLNDLTLTITTATGPLTYYCFREAKGILYVPLAYDASWLSGSSMVESGPHRKCDFKPVKVLMKKSDQLERGVEPDKVKDQQEIFDEVKDMISFALCLSTGFGKTTLSSILAAHYGEKVVVLCGNLGILDQWEAEFIECGATVAKITNPKAKEIPDVDVLLCTIEVGRKLTPDQVADVGTVIYDEAHLSTVTAVSETLLNFTPNRLIMCTATLERKDGAHDGLSLYHGGRTVKRVLKKTFELVRCESGIAPDTSKKVNIGGRRRINYTHAMESVYSDPRFPIIVANLIRDVLAESDGRVLVLFRENDPLYAVAALLKDVEYFIANKQVSIKKELGEEKLILAIDKKAKEGVDIKGLKDVVMTYSSNSIHQPEGRVRDDDFRVWIVVHDHAMHEKHWRLAKEWAEERSRGEYRMRTVKMTVAKQAASSSSAPSGK